MCPDWALNQGPFGSQSSAQSTEPHQPGPKLEIFMQALHIDIIFSAAPHPHPHPELVRLFLLAFWMREVRLKKLLWVQPKFELKRWWLKILFLHAHHTTCRAQLLPPLGGQTVKVTLILSCSVSLRSTLFCTAKPQLSWRSPLQCLKRQPPCPPCLPGFPFYSSNLSKSNMFWISWALC